VHSVDNDGVVCVNLNDFNELSDSIRFRTKIDHLTEQYLCSKNISHFSICMLFRGGQRYYLSNLYLWAIPYRTEGLSRGDVDHDRSIYNGKEFFIQRNIQYDTMQTPIIQILESRYQLSTTFAMVRQCHECDLIVEAYNNVKVTDPEKLYHEVREDFERFICHFLDAMQPEIVSALPNQKWLSILTDKEYRKKVITRKTPYHYLAILTPREVQCLSLIADGLSTKAVAEQLFLSNETVNTHAKSIRQKMECKNIAEAVAKACRWGIV
jgi:DNA-binding CsgD family transcriptional regulator